MVRRYIHSEPTSKLAIWALRIAGFAVAASVLAILVVRSGLLEIEPALATFGGALAIAVVAFLVALAAFVVIWMEGLAGMRAAFAAMAISLAHHCLSRLSWPQGLSPALDLRRHDRSDRSTTL